MEVVFSSSEASRSAHRNLYHFSEQSYITVSDDLIGAIMAFEGEPGRLHVSSDWAGIVGLAVWKSAPGMSDLFLLLRSFGISSEELRPFKDAGIPDLFPWLFYGRRFDVLRKVCLAAKTNLEKHLRNGEIRVHCHLACVDTKHIVASSL